MLTPSPLRLALVLFLCSCAIGPALAQERPFNRRAITELDSLRKQIDTEGLSGYAPSQFKEALELYREAKAAVRENEDDDELRERLSEARQALREALQTARIAKTALAEVDVARKQMRRVPYFEENEDELRDAGREYRDALEEAEKGDIEDTRDHAAEMMEAYRAATRIALREKDLEEARAALDEAEDRITEMQYDYARERLDRIEDEIQDADEQPFAIASFYERYRRRIRDEIRFIYPDFYQNPPDTLLVGDFTLVVDSFHTRNWDFDREQITGADGTAWVSFSCERVLTQPPVDFAPRTFEVVEEVVNPRRQISEETAEEVEEEAEVGEEIRLAVPPDSLGQMLRPEDIPRAALQPRIPPHLIGGSNPGDIKLSFSGLRIEPTGRPNVGRVLAGWSRYPTPTPTPSDATLDIAGFTVHLEEIAIAPKEATAQVELEFPESVRDSMGHPARYLLGQLPITPTCQLQKAMPDSTYGPWTVAETGVEIEGRGLVADFSTQWKWPQAPTSQADSWRGVILPSGHTIAATDTVRSNTGYLQADYDYTDAQVTAQGLEAKLNLAQPFPFRPLQPTGYLVTLRDGGLRIDNSAITGGGFSEGAVRLPRSVVRTAAGGTAELGFDKMTVQEDLDLVGILPSTVSIGWARPGTERGFSPYYSLKEGGPRVFYLSGTPRIDFRAARQATFGDPGLADLPEAQVADSAEAHGVQGLILSQPGEATIHTPDTDGGQPITLPVYEGWVHVGGRGVNGSMLVRRDLAANPQLGETSNRVFESPTPFDFSLRRPNDQPTDLKLQFVESAVFESDGQGQIALGKAVQDSLAVRDVAITSTAQIPAVELDTTSHTVQLSFWGLDLVTQEGMQSPGVASVKTGVIYLTGAGLAERRHFAEPFDLIWGEILADGRFRTEDLKMDLNAHGQALDTFAFTPTTLNLSPYTSPGDAGNSYLQVGGTVHFNFFSAQHLHVIDRNNPDSTQAPFGGRYVTLADTSGRAGIEPTTRELRGNWSNGFARMQYALGYAEEAQNGFVGPGTMDLTVLFMSPLTSSFRAADGRTCMNVREMNRADVRLGPVAHFGAATEIKGCACVSEQRDGELQRLALSASLMQASNLNVALRSARYGELSFVHTPTVTDLQLHGDYSLGTLVTDLAVNGSARFTVNHAENYVDGTIQGALNTEAGSGLIAGASLQASGTLDWHLGAGVGGDHYQSLQGRVQTDMMGGNVLASSHTGAEGGFYVGINAPKDEAWVIKSADSRARVDMTPFPARLTGIYGYLQVSQGVNTILFGGGVETMVGLGLFGLTANQFANVDAQADPVQLVAQGATGTLIPYGVGKMWVHVWGEILKGALRAEGTTDLMLIGPRPFGFQGELTLGGCVAWVLCGDVTLGCGLNTAQDGFYVNTK